MLYESRIKPLLFRLDAERAHEEIAGLMALLAPFSDAIRAGKRNLERTVFGLRFPNPVGLAAGFDKDGKLASFLPALGFGFVEIGSVTLEAQSGNPKPRLFRLPEQRALINRMGFNSEGARLVARRLASAPRPAVPLGINLGLNKGADAVTDYARTFRILSTRGDYFVINVSSPNTPGLRDLQKVKELTAILESVQEANPARKPILLKLSPDLSEEDFAASIETAGKLAQGLVIANTTIEHEGETGGLSGAPLKARATELVRRARALTKLPIIGVGGIETPEDARERLGAGADLIQIYTGLIYGGPAAVKRILKGLAVGANSAAA